MSAAPTMPAGSLAPFGEARDSARRQLFDVGLTLVGRLAYSAMIWMLLMALVPMLWGWRPTVVSSGSMAPAVRTGDVLLAEPGDGEGSVPGTVILYEDAVRGDIVAHRIRSVTEDGRFITQGDANPGADSTPVDPGRVQGVGRMLVPYAGLPAHWWRNGNWPGLAAFAAGVGAAVWLGHRRRGSRLRIGRAGRLAALGAAMLALGILVAPVIAAFSDSTSSSAGNLASDTLDPPSSVDATFGGGGTVLNWTATPDTYAGGYRVYRSSTADCCYGYVGSVTGWDTTTYLDPGTGGSGGISFESVATAVGDGASLVIDRPSGTIAGDLLIGVLTLDTHEGETLLPPAGWTEIAVQGTTGRSGNTQTGVWYRSAGGSEPASYAFAWGSEEQAVGAVIRYSGVDTADPIGVFATQVGESATPIAPSVTTTVAGSTVVRLFGADDHDLPAPPAGVYPPGSSGRYAVEGSGSGAVSGAGADEVQAVAGVTGGASFSLRKSEKWVAMTISLNPQSTPVTTSYYYVVESYAGSWVSIFSNQASP